jgi:hypothetical protein
MGEMWPFVFFFSLRIITKRERVEHERVKNDNKKWIFGVSSLNFRRMSPSRVRALRRAR